MKILIINPPAFKKQDYIREGRCMQTKSSWAALWMPLSLGYISAVLRNNGHQVMLTMLSLINWIPENLVKYQHHLIRS